MDVGCVGLQPGPAKTAGGCSSAQATSAAWSLALAAADPGSHIMQDAEAALKVLADSRPPGAIGKQAYHLYERFRPTVHSGTGGWGQKAELRLDKIRDMATEKQ